MNDGRRILALGASLALAATTVSGQGATRLAAGQTIDADLKGGGVNVYEVELTAGSFFSATFDQRGADVKPIIIGPDGKTLYDYDGSEYGWEPAVVIAPVTGVYRLEARSPRANAAAGRYQLHVDAIRPPTPEDEARVHIGSLESEALVSYRGFKPEGVRHARELFEQVLKEYQALGDSRGEAHAYRALASITNAQDDFAAQAAYRRKEIALRRQLGDDYGEAEALLGLGLALRVLGEMDDSREALERSLAIEQAAGQLGGVADALHELAILHRTSGDLGLALDQEYQSLAMARRLGDKQREGTAQNALGIIAIALGETDVAIESFRAAARDDPRDTQQARTAAGIGFALVKLGRDDEAEPLIKQALEFWARRKWRGEEANTLRTLGEMYAHRSETNASRADLERARDAFEQSAAKASEASYPASESLARMRLGEILMRLERLDDAEKALSDALTLADRSSDAGVKADVLADQATLALARGDLSPAHRLAEDALTAVESTRAVAQSSRVRTAMLASSQRVYEAFVRVLMAEHAANPTAGFDRRALEVSERARARSLLDMVMDVSAISGPPPSGSALDDLRTLQQRIHGKAQALDEAQRRKLTTAPAIAGELDELVHQFGLAETRVRRENPDAATVASPEPLTADAIQQQVLDRQTVLVEYMLGESASYAWVLSQGSLSTFTLARRAEIAAATERFRAGLSIPPAAAGATASTSATPAASLAALSRLLLAPLGRLPAGTRLLIVAPGSLQQVPFAALTAGDGALVAHHEIVHAPSASIVAAVRSLTDRRAPASRTLAVFADPVFEASDPRVTARQTEPDAAATAGGSGDPSPLARAVRSVTPGGKTLARLPFTRREADAIVALAPRGSVLEATDFEASLRQVMRPSLADYRLLHFATHGLLDTRTPELSGLVFSLVTEQGRPQDGFLRLTDISRLRLNADLAVLSGCDTGRGRAVDGEGVIGLTRGFVIAGARRVVASLWAVDDLATAEFMKRFYRQMLVRHRSPSAALAIAQRQMAASDRWSAPYFWAGFVIQGEWRE